MIRPTHPSNSLYLLTAFFVLVFVMIIGQIEASAQQGPSANKALKRMDTDGDGKISRSEWMGPPPAFGKIDSNQDNSLNYFVLDKWFAKRRGKSTTSTSTGTSSPWEKPHVASQTNTKMAGIKWSDTHIHLRRGTGSYEGAIRHAIQLMDKSNIKTAILMPPPLLLTGRAGNRYDAQQLTRLLDKYPGRFLFLGGGSLINGIIENTPHDQVTSTIKDDFSRKANSILDAGARGFGEMGMMHLGHFPGHPSYWVQPDHPLFLLLADIAGERNAVIDVHMDVVKKEARTPGGLHGENPPIMQANLDSFERFVAHNRNARIVLAHAGWDVTGQWSPELSRSLFDKHPNLFMSLKIYPKGGQSKNNLMKGVFKKSVNDKWLAVIKEFPNRFVIGSDSFIAEVGAKGQLPGGLTKFYGAAIATFLQKLPPDLAEKIATENVEKIYGAS